MSKLALDLEQALSTDRESVSDAIAEIKERRAVPGFDAYGRYSHQYLSSALKTAKLFFAGAPTWDSGSQAIEETMKVLHGKLLPRLIELLGYGIHVGRKGYGEDTNFKELFNDKQFKVGAGFEGLAVACDEDARKAVTEFLGAQLGNAYRATGFDKAPPHETVHVWDVWYAALAGGSATIYKAGYQLGCKWREEEILKGIFEATEKSD